MGFVRMSDLADLGAAADPCGPIVDAEIAALEALQANQRAGAPAAVISALQAQYRSIMLGREACRRQNNMAVQTVVQPGRTTEQTVANLRAEAQTRAAAGDTATATQLRSTADQIVDQAAADMLRRSQQTAPTPASRPPVAPPAPARTAASPADIQFNFTSAPVSSAPQVTLPDFNAVGTALQTSAAASAGRIAEAAALSAERAARGPVQLTAAPIARPKEQGLSTTAILLIAGGGVVLVGGAILLLSMGRAAPVAPPQPWGPPPPGWGPPPGWVPQAMSPPATANRGRRRGRSRT